MNTDIKRVGAAIILSGLLSLFFTIIFYHSDIEDKLTELTDDREIINLLREDSPYSAHSWMIDEEFEVIRLAIEDVNISIEYEPVYYVSKGITFSFSIEDEGKNSLSKKEIKLPVGHVYLIHDEKVISSLTPKFIHEYNKDYRYGDNPPYQIVNIEKMLDGKYKYHLTLTPDDIGKWRLLILCTDQSNTRYDYSGKKIEWEERIFEVTSLDPPIFPKKEIICFFLTIFGLLSYPLYKFYPKLKNFWQNEKKSILEILIFYFLVIFLLLTFLIL